VLTQTTPQRRLRILVTDDNQINQKVTTRLVENLGHRVDVVSDGKEAVEAFKFISYDIILMDLEMPEMDGFEASLQIRLLKNQDRRRTSVIAITSHARKEDQQKCLAWGFDDYVAKPILPAELKAAIERTITQTSSNRASPSPAQTDSDGDDIDLVDALARVDGDRELLGEIGLMFLAQYPVLLGEIHQALSIAKSAALASAVHMLGSSAGQVGATRALRIARQIQDLAERRDLANVPATLAALEAEIELVKSALVAQGFVSPTSATPGFRS
jgi:CheY-like chemotaxis protein/HPt (histidine-containing phosphotransfer) domain-containing protein